MTKKKLRSVIAAVIALFLIYGIVGYLLFINQDATGKNYYTLFKDLMPFLIAIPGAYLGYTFQKRSHYVIALRKSWESLIETINSTIIFTNLPSYNKKKHLALCLELRKNIDEIRGIYKNIEYPNKQGGLYPYEALKNIYRDVTSIHDNNSFLLNKNALRYATKRNWYIIKQSFLAEIDRSKPTFYDTDTGAKSL